MLPLISPFGLSPPLISRPYQDGVELIGIPGITGVAVANGTTPAAAVEVSYRWPQTMILREWILMPESGLKADAAAIGLRIVDQEGAIVWDGSGLNAAAQFVAPFAEQGIAPSGFHLTGWTWSPQWNKFARLVRAGEQWIFTVINSKAGGGAITPRLLFHVEAPIEEPTPSLQQRLT